MALLLHSGNVPEDWAEDRWLGQWVSMQRFTFSIYCMENDLGCWAIRLLPCATRGEEEQEKQNAECVAR